MLEEMEAAVTGMEMVAVVERYFLQHLLRADTQRLVERDAEPKMPTHNETLGEQARRYNKSERWLQKRYAKVYGMSFKQMQNNLKFHQAHQVLSRAVNKREPVNLTTVAYHFGYFDQAHFIKDFKRYTGMTPGQYLRAHVGPENQYLFYW
jgi:AraC-like DNA-binding protein